MIWTDEKSFRETHCDLTDNYFKWLVLPQNLTDTIQQSNVDFSLNCLSQKLEIPYPDEQDCLQKEDLDATLALVRKVVLLGNQIPLIYARVIIPKCTYLEYQYILDNLGNSPIGNTMLYSDPNTLRTPFEFKCVHASEALFNELQPITPQQHQGDYWARRSLFTLTKGALLISEIFFNNLPTYPYSTA